MRLGDRAIKKHCKRIVFDLKYRLKNKGAIINKDPRKQGRNLIANFDIPRS
jgi:hypothetical protein